MSPNGLYLLEGTEDSGKQNFVSLNLLETMAFYFCLH